MKFRSVALVVSGLIAFSGIWQAAAAACAPAPLGLVSWWRAESNANDFLAVNNGTLLNGLGFSNGKVGFAFNFDGADDRVIVPNSPSLNFGANQDFSVEAWILPLVSATDFGIMTIVDKRYVPNISQSMGYTVVLIDGRLHCRISDSASGNGIAFTAGPDLRDGQFHHIAVAVQRTSTSGGKFYVDGQPIFIFDPTSVPGALSNSEPLNIGYHSDPSLHASFKGIIDELSIYNKALSSEEVQAIYTAKEAGKCASPEAPLIITQPTNLAAVQGDTVIFTVVASGTLPLSYQWQKGGSDISGATASSLVLGNVQLADSGSYLVIVSNVVGLATSSVATLTVSAGIPPSILSQPVSQTVFVGEGIIFNVSASGTPPLTYQWQKDGVNINGATDTSLVLPNVQLADAGAYSVVVSNIAAAVTSANATLTVNPPPPCVPAPVGLVSWWRADGNADDFLNLNNGVLLNGLGFSNGEVGSAFNFDGNDDRIIVSNSPSLNFGANQDFSVEAWILPLVSATDYGVMSIVDKRYPYSPAVGYTVALLDGRLHCRIADPASGDGIAFTAGPDLRDGRFHHIAVAVERTSAAGGKFYVDGQPVFAFDPTPVPGALANSEPLNIGYHSNPSLHASFKGIIDELAIYSRALLTNEVQAIYSAAVSGKCSTPVPPTIATQPQDATVTIGDTAVFSVTASGTELLTYQWQKNSTAILGATAASLVLTNVQLVDAGAYLVTVTNAAGAATSSNATLTVKFPPARVQVPSVEAAAGQTFTVPILLVANGNENALGFSLNFDPGLMTYVHADLGPGASGATLLVNTNELGSGKLGLAIAFPTESNAAAGTQEVVQVTFAAGVVLSSTSTLISFGDVPIGRELSDAASHELAATYIAATVSIAAAEWEADVSPRPTGDRNVTITDWVLVGRYAAALDAPTNAAEFQRADCAPRSSLGDGAITVIDWVQAGRYAARLDPLTVLGGPTSPFFANASLSPKRGKKDGSTRCLRVMKGFIAANQAATVSVILDGLGDENALGFSMTFDPAILTYKAASLGSGAVGASLNVNANQAVSGRLGFALALPPGSSFATGARQLLNLSFGAATSASTISPVSLADQPVLRQTSDAAAMALATAYVDGTISVNPLPSLNVVRSGENLILSWPLWAANFVLQENANGLSPAATWKPLSATLLTNGNSLVVTLPLGGGSRLYRLAHQ